MEGFLLKNSSVEKTMLAHAHTQNKLVLDLLSASHVGVDEGQYQGSGLRNVVELRCVDNTLHHCYTPTW